MCPWLKDYENKHAFERSEAAFDIFKLIFEELDNALHLIFIIIGQDWLEQGRYINFNGHEIGYKDQDLDQDVLETLIPSRANFGRNFDGKGDEMFWRCYFEICALRSSGFSRCIVRLGLSGSSLSIQKSGMDKTLCWKNMSPDLIGCLIQNIFIDMKEIKKN
ncbi:hypothetical protein BS50DRAFT_584147 [Corynespora cassiicola Philippines]|uniref:Uncharacterized protein n=1 Tax=Corynespora cassiicola Philippines TaxID=1448308 RepID=A0A2T2P4M9_CORCC|nr:hypothetical protein BS50DRAFT_584147 [Corynespora cassiicola Philippines]